MNKHLDKITKKYMRTARCLLSCPRKYRRQFMKDMERDIELFIRENEPNGYPDIISYFGTPAELAQTYLESVPQDELTDYRIKRTSHITITGTVLVALLLSATVLLFISIQKPRELDVIYVEESIEVLDERIE